MNPLMMIFGMGCGCGVNMPFYGMNDRLTFMNFPVFRNTSSDYLLDPRLAMMQGMQNWMNGGSIYGNSYLPLYNNFPGINLPWLNNVTNSSGGGSNNSSSDTPEVTAQKAKLERYKKYFDILKKNIDNDDSDFKELKAQYDNALKESKLEDKLKKIEEVFEQLDPEYLRNIALADTKISSDLFKAGYNFTNENSFGHEITSTEVDWNSYLKNYNSADQDSVGNLGSTAGNINTHTDQILQVISSWNDTHNGDKEKGLLRTLTEHLPKVVGQQTSWQQTAITLSNALTTKANQFANKYGGMRKFEKLQAQCTKVETLLKDIKDWSKNTSIDDDSETALRKKKEQITKLADEFDKLYAMLRIMEAKALNKKILKEYADDMNSIKEGAIPDDIIIKETEEDLKAENISIPADSELDEIPERGGIKINRTTRQTNMETIDSETKNDPDKKVEKLVDKEKLAPVEGYEGIYETTADDTNVPKKYYGISEENKLVEVVLNPETNEFEVVSDNDTKAADIGQYVDTVNKLNNYIDTGKLEPCQTEGLYKSKDAWFIIKDNKLVRINGTVDASGNVTLADGTQKTIGQLTSSDVSEVTSESDLYVKPPKPQQEDSTPETENDDSDEDKTNTGKTEVTKTKINIDSEAFDKGDATATYVEGITDEMYYSEIDESLKNLDKDTVFDFLAGFYSHDFHEGIIEYLDDEQSDGALTIDGKKNLIESFVEFAISKGISESDSRIRTIKLILKKYNNDAHTEDNGFRDGNLMNFSRGFWNGVSSIWGDGKSDNEVLDDKLKSLFNELKEE